MGSPVAATAIAVPSGLHDGYELRRPGTLNDCNPPCRLRTTMPPPDSTAIREPSGEKVGFRDSSGSPSVTRCRPELASTTRNASLRPRLNAEKSIEPPSGDQLIPEFG